MNAFPAALTLAATRLPASTLLAIGAVVAVIITLIGYSHWRGAVKTAFIVLLLEGAIRKWVFPQGQELVYFLKDIILIGPYLKFFLAPDLDLRTWKLNIPSFWIGVLVVALIPSALNPNIGSLLLGLYGLKIYIYYVPLVFMMPYLFRTRDEMIKQLNWYVMLAIPICLLGLAQWQQGAASPLNVYAHQESIEAGGAVGFGFGEKVRITGTFSYITGHTTFVIFFMTLLLFLLSLAETPRKWVLISVCAPLLIANGLMNGSRSFAYALALVLAGFFLANLRGRIGTNKNFISILFAGFVVSLVAGAYIFYDAYAYLSARNVASGETFKMRTIDSSLIALEWGLKEGGVGGYGIGTTHPATYAIRRAFKIPPPKLQPPVFDNELGQTLTELGPLGFLSWYGLRFLLFVLTWQAFERSPPSPVKTIALATTLISIPYFIMGVVLNHTSNMLLFGMVGLSMLARLESAVYRRSARTSARTLHSLRNQETKLSASN